MQLEEALQAIRPRRESETGWTPETFAFPGNQNSLALNERGPALNVFWTRLWRVGRKAGEPTGLSKASQVVRNDCPKNRAGGSRIWSHPVRSFRFEHGAAGPRP